MIINIIFITVIIAGIIGIFFCLEANKRNVKSGPPALALLLMITASTVVILARSLSPDDRGGGLVISEELFYSRASGLVLGRHLAKTSPDFNALIITHDKTFENTLLDASLEGLREGLGDGGKVEVVAIDSPVPPPSDVKSERLKISPEKMLYFSRQMHPGYFNHLIREYPDCNLIISLIVLPKDVVISSKKAKNRPKMALLLSNISMMKDMISEGVISAAVITRPKYVPGRDKLPKNVEAAFDKRYLLVTPENVKTVASDHPGIFNK
jgi:hypothetical protein